MDKRLLRNILVIFLVSALAFGLARYIIFLNENIRTLEEERVNLLQDIEKERNIIEKLKLKNEGLLNNLRLAHKRIERSFADMEKLKENNEELSSRAGVLKAQNAALEEEKAAALKENEALKAKLSSIPELKEVIKELKRGAGKGGNRGYLIKDGKPQSASSLKVKIEVVPAAEK
jgi:chromosome segregation ATPase